MSVACSAVMPSTCALLNCIGTPKAMAHMMVALCAASMPFDVERRVGLGIAQALRLLEHGGEIEPLVAHLAQDEVGRAVDDAGHPFDAIGGEPLAQRLDDRDAAGHRRLESDHHALGVRGGEDLVAVHRQQRLVGSHDVFAFGNGLQHQGLGGRRATDQLDHDVDRRVGDDAARVVDHLRRVADDAACARKVEVGHRGDADLTPGAALDLFLIALQHFECAAADRADAEQADLDRFGFDITSLRDMSLRRTTSCCHLALLDR